MIAIHLCIKSFGVEASLIVLLLRNYLNKSSSDEIKMFLTDNEIDWNHLYQLTLEYEIRPIIFKVVSKQTERFDEFFIEKLRQDCFLLAAESLEKVQEVSRLHQLFSKAGIEVIPYKGIFFSNIVYGEFTNRETCDIDLFIRPFDFLKTKDLLLANGYSTGFFNDDLQDYLLKFKCDHMFLNESATNFIQVEVHWNLLNRIMDVPINSEALFEEVEIISIAGGELKTFNLETTLIIMICHHAVNDVWRTPKHLIDFSAFINKYNDKIDWKELLLQIEKLRIKKPAYIGFQLANQVFGSPIPTEFLHHPYDAEPILKELFCYPMLRKQKFSIENVIQHLRLRDTTSDQVRLLWKYFLAKVSPNPEDLAFTHLPKNWFWVYYFIKPIRFFSQKLR